MSRYLDELENEVLNLEDVFKDVNTAFDNMKEDFNHMKWQLEDIESALNSNQTVEEKLDEIESIIRR